MWGGSGNIIIPTDGKTISPLFWHILERFDPDYLQVYRRTYSDIELEEPSKFEELYQKLLASWEQQIGEKSHPLAAKKLRDDLRWEGLTTFALSSDLQQQLKERLAPFYFQQYVAEAGSVTATSTPHHAQTDIIDILPHAAHPSRVLKVTANPAVAPPLWWASYFGCINAELETELTKLNVGVLTCGSTSAEIRQLIELAVQGYNDIHSSAFLANTSVDVLQQILQAFPSRFSMVGLGYYRSISAHDWEEPVIAVAGNTVQDFTLYYALSRLRPHVVWVLPSLTEDALMATPPPPAVDERFHFASALNRVSRADGQRCSGLKLTSLSLSNAHLQQVGARIQKAALIQGVEVGIPENSMDCIPEHPLRYFEANNASVMRSVAVADDVIELFETPLPKNFTSVNPSKHR